MDFHARGPFTIDNYFYVTGLMPIVAPFTLLSWWRPTGAGSYQSILTLADAADPGARVQMRVSNGNTYQCLLYAGSNVTNGASVLHAAVVDTWILQAAVVEAARIQSFVNGIGPFSASTFTGTFPTLNQASVGAQHRVPPSQACLGPIRQCSVVARALSAAQILAIYSNRLDLRDVRGAIHLWEVNKVGDTVYDVVGGKHMTEVGAVPDYTTGTPELVPLNARGRSPRR